MPAYILYSFKLSVCLGVVYLFYYLVLRQLTFYNWNRWYLLAGTGLSFLIPLVNVLPSITTQEPNNLNMIKAMPTFQNLSDPVLYAANTSDFFNEYWYYVIPVLFGLGLIVQAGKLTIQFVSFFRLRRSATQLQKGSINIYQVDKPIAPFSFCNAIFLNKNILSPAELQEIIRHEQVHIIQKHTIDVLWLECLCLVNWFNPFAWLLKQAVRQNLEFIVDRAVLMEPDLDKKYYQYLLLKVIGLPNLSIANQFNISSLKTRIMMMNKTPSNKRELAKFLFVLPIMTLLLLSCQEDTSLTETNKVRADLKQELPPPPPPVVATFNFDNFLKQNPNIKNITPEVQGDSISSMVVELKSGKREVYNFKDDAQFEKFKQRYGFFPIHNLPPPPPPVVLPASSDHTLFMERNPQVENLGWQGDKTAVIFLKSGKREEYDLDKPESKAEAEKKYGKVPELVLPKGVTQFTPPIIKKDK